MFHLVAAVLIQVVAVSLAYRHDHHDNVSNNDRFCKTQHWQP